MVTCGAVFSQRQICAGVCHLKCPPHCVSLMCRHDMKMIKQTAGYVELGSIIGPTGTTDGLMGLNSVVEELCVQPSCLSEVKRRKKS